jgi:hypothetical protein
VLVKVALREHARTVFDEDSQKLVRFRRQMHRFAAAYDLAGLEIQHRVANAQRHTNKVVVAKFIRDA